LQCQVYGCCNERKIVHEGKASNSFTKFLTGGSADFGSWKTYVAGSNPARNIENYLCFFVRPMEGWRGNWKGCRMRRSWHDWRYYSGVCLERLRKTTKVLMKAADFRDESWTLDVPKTKKHCWPVSTLNS
jgi:hypothetical protein